MLIPPLLDRLYEEVSEELDSQGGGLLGLLAEFLAPSVTRMLSCVAQAIDGSKIKYGGRAQALPMLVDGRLQEFREEFYPQWVRRARQNGLLVDVDFAMSGYLVEPESELTTDYVDGLKLKELDEMESPEFCGALQLTRDTPWLLTYGGTAYEANVSKSRDPFARVFAYANYLSSVTRDFQQTIDIVQEELWETLWIARARYKASPDHSKDFPTKRYAFVF